MAISSNVSLKFKNYKSFGDTAQGFDRIAPINVIIGRNNSGKSALLDLIDFATSPRDLSEYGHLARTPTFYLTLPLPESVIRQVFDPATSGGVIGGNHYQYGKQWIDKPITVELGTGNSKSYYHLEPEPHNQYLQDLAHRVTNPFDPYTFKRIYADRNIQPELPAPTDLSGDGGGVANIIRYFLHDSKADQKMVEQEMLNALNGIFKPDISFTRIQAKQLPDERWEIYLEEENKGSIALSNSGSGLKTVIQVLAQTLLVPKLEGRELKQYVFGFEELENNLHPGLQRKLFSFIRNLATKKDVTFFITTHSNVVIDLFSGDSEAQLLHVTYDKQSAQVRALTEYTDNAGVLDDLDVRASDILQSNGVIWVEGPSDRVYINKFIELMSGDKLREGAHYQCVFYGGRLLARVTAKPNDDEGVNLLKVNRNSSIVIDSDRRSKGGKINKTKARLKSEIESIGGYSWVTDGKEIENNIPVEAIRQLYSNDSINSVATYQLFNEYLDKIRPGEGKKFLSNKILFAENISEHITLDMINADPKLKKHVKKICVQITSWNKLTL